MLSGSRRRRRCIPGDSPPDLRASRPSRGGSIERTPAGPSPPDAAGVLPSPPPSLGTRDCAHRHPADGSPGPKLLPEPRHRAGALPSPCPTGVSRAKRGPWVPAGVLSGQRPRAARRTARGRRVGRADMGLGLSRSVAPSVPRVGAATLGLRRIRRSSAHGLCPSRPCLLRRCRSTRILGQCDDDRQRQPWAAGHSRAGSAPSSPASWWRSSSEHAKGQRLR